MLGGASVPQIYPRARWRAYPISNLGTSIVTATGDKREQSSKSHKKAPIALDRGGGNTMRLLDILEHAAPVLAVVYFVIGAFALAGLVLAFV